MHIQRVQIREIKSIKEFDMAFEPNEELAGWHVLIGDNGSGKSTVLKAIALALVGARSASGLNDDWEGWIPSEGFNPAIPPQAGLAIVRHSEQDYLDEKVAGYFHPAFEIYSNMKGMTEPIPHTTSLSHFGILDTKRISLIKNRFIENPSEKSGNWLGDEKGWFSAAYGPYRRFTGSSTEYDRIYKNNQRLGAHISIFREDSALTEVIGWLRAMRLRELELLDKNEGSQPLKFFLPKLGDFINHGDFLPYGVQFKHVSSSGVFFTDASGSTIAMQNLSDGYRSILSMTFEIIRQMQIAYQTDDLFSDDGKSIKMPGVVLIDEVDAHLHPTWQRKIGPWFRQHFPKVQFIVTTHSPLICQAAEPGHGSVWKLPRPGTDETCMRVTGQDLNRLLYGNILEAYSTQLFGLTETRSQEGHEKLERLAQLNVKEVFQGLSDEEKKLQAELRSTLPTEANTIEANS